MDTPDLLQLLDVDPASLEQAPPGAPIGSSGTRRLAEHHPCLRCGKPATAAGVLEVPGRGLCWIDRCTPCLVATTPRASGPPTPLEDTLAALREAALEARVRLHVMLERERQDAGHG